jgi:hypothetical protein
MNRIIKTSFWTVAITLAFTMLALFTTAAAQKARAVTPHDFSNDYYIQHGVSFKGLIWRRTGSDGLSVIDPRQDTVRVIVTVPSYDQSGAISYWYPLGELTNAGFLDTEVGILARETAKFFPMYVFPDEKYINYNTIANTRQAPIIDNSWNQMGMRIPNPLGLREMFLVKYTEKAHSKDGVKMMDYMAQKNGRGTDSMPIMNTVADIQMLYADGYIILETPGEGPDRGHYAVAPLITDPTNGVIAPDAFLWMSTRTGYPLEREMMFVDQFACLQKLHTWCADGF